MSLAALWGIAITKFYLMRNMKIVTKPLCGIITTNSIHYTDFISGIHLNKYLYQSAKHNKFKY